MDLRLTPDLIEIRERSRRFCDEWLIPFENETEEAGSLPAESYGRIRTAVLDANLNAMNMPVEWGGQGFSILQQVVALEQLGRVTNALWACVWRPAQVLEHCTPAQRKRFLEPECRGERRYAYAITEPNAGSDVSRLETAARRVEGGWSISGEKWFVTDADIADYLIVVAEADGFGQTCFLVDSDAAGVRETRRPRYMHTFAFEHPEYAFEDCFVPDDQVLGAPGQGNDLSKDWFTDERLMIAARCIGGAERALETALAYAQERVQFGGPIIDNQGVSFPLADCAVEIAATRALTYQVAWECGTGIDRKTIHAKASQVKLYASEMAGRVVDRCVQVLGGRGVTAETPVMRIFADMRAFRIYDGPSEVHRWSMARALVRRAQPRDGAGPPDS